MDAMEKRLDNLEDKLKATFIQIDKKFGELQKSPSIQQHVTAQPQKFAEMEERFNRLEEKLKATFQEIDKRLHEPQKAQELDYEDRIQELEDLLLLLQLENTKLKEKVGEGLDFGIVPSVPDISERLTRIESEIASSHAPVGDVDAKIASLEERISSLTTAPDNLEKGIKQSRDTEVAQLEKRIKTLEALLEDRGRKEIEEDGLFSDIVHILRG